MRITKIEINKLNIKTNEPMKVSVGVLDAARNVVVKIHAENGLYGWGESSPFAPITGDTQESNYAMAIQLAQLIKGGNCLALEELMTSIHRFTIGDSSIRSAFDMALYDLAAKCANMPLYRFLGGERRELRTDLTIGRQDTVEETVSKAQAVVNAGFDAIKLKVGRPEFGDVAHVAAVRDLVGPDIAIKIDSNQGWDYPTAVANLKAMAPLNLDYSEQPLVAWDYLGLKRLRRKVDLPICADESLFTDKDALKLISSEAVDYLNIKLGKSGGIHVALKINAIAEAAQAKCMIGCFAESRLALSAAAHLALARPNITFLDLDSCYHFKSDPVLNGVTFDEKIGGLLHLPETPGHGAEIDETQLDASTLVVV